MAEFKEKRSDNYGVIVIAEGQELKVGVKAFYGPRTFLIGGKEVEICEQIYGGDWNLENGKTISVVDGIITEVKDTVNVQGNKTAISQIKEDAKKRKEQYRK